MEQRVTFNKGKQKEFLNLVKTKLNVTSIKGILQFGFDIPYSTLKNYYNEVTSLPRDFFEDLCHLSKINPKNLQISYIEGNWGAQKGGIIGMRALQKKYPKEMNVWRKLGGENSPGFKIINMKKIKIPELDEDLAEFIGAYLGDGTLTKYFLRISGDYRYDLPYFNYLSELVKKLFGINSVIDIEKGKNTCSLRICSIKVCSFLNQKYNIKYGHKIRNKTTIPKEILKDRKLVIACLRGLVDTDGSVTRRGNQFSVEFTSHNRYLLEQVINIGKDLEIFTYHNPVSTGTNSWNKVEKYFKIVGSSNLRHIIRFHLKKYRNKKIYIKDILEYYKQDLYKNINLPYKI